MRLRFRLGKLLAIQIATVLILSCPAASAQAGQRCYTEGSAASILVQAADSEMASAVLLDRFSNAGTTDRSACATVTSGYFIQGTGSISRNANLTGILLSSWATIETAFDPEITEYNISIPYDKTYLEIIPEKANSAAHYSLSIDGKIASSIVYVRLGQSKTVYITVSAQNGIIEKTYALNIQRSIPTDQLLTSFLDRIPTATMTYEELIHDDGTRERPPKADTLPSPDTYLLEIDVVNQYITVYIRDKDGNYTIPYRFMICSTGARATPTPIGTFKMGGYKKRFGYFRKYDCYAQYWTNLVGGIYFHSIIYNSRSDKHLSTGSYRKLGSAVSHGCIRLLPPDAKWIYDNCAPGTTVVVTKSKDPDPFLCALLEPPPIS